MPRTRAANQTLRLICGAVLAEPWAVTRAARVALTPFNDAILRFAFECGLTAIDLRLVSSNTADYANPIEPSGRGGLKTARAIVHAVGARAGPPPATVHSAPDIR
jgi:hypothetical protein